MKSGEDFRKSAIENNIHHWPVHNCSMCGYECGFLFDYRGYPVVYDAGCDCTRQYVKHERSWDDVAEQYNIQKNEKVINEMNKYWRF